MELSALTFLRRIVPADEPQLGYYGAEIDVPDRRGFATDPHRRHRSDIANRHVRPYTGRQAVLLMGKRRGAIFLLEHPVQSNKLATDELRQLVLEDSTEAVGVLIQPSLDRPKVAVSKLNRGGVTINVPVGVEASPTEDDGSTERRVAEAAEFLKEVLGTAPHWLPAARSFVAKVTPQQLRIIAESPSIEAVWPNRELRPSILSVAASS